jgi:hypothetical protein
VKFRKVIAILSTTVLPKDGIYAVHQVENLSQINLQGVPHYIGHPATKQIVESLGAVQAPTRLFTGLEVGETALCFAIAQGKSTRTTQGFTSPHQDVTLDDLAVQVIVRLPDEI